MIVEADVVRLDFARETWAFTTPFRIAGRVFTSSELIRVTLRDGIHEGHGECEGDEDEDDPRKVDEVVAEIERFREALAQGMAWDTLFGALANPRVRNALDCAWWDLNAKRTGIPVWQAAQLPPPKPVVTAYTISLDSAEEMARHAFDVRHRELLKVKLGRPDGDIERIRAVRCAAPDSTLIVDANEGWSFDQLGTYAALLADLGVALIEQPLPAGRDAQLAAFRSPVPLCADESCQDRRDLGEVVSRYQFINIKLDKTGGLTEALALAREAQALGLGIMVGCMAGTSLAMAPATLVAAMARYVDLDGPLMLGQDRAVALAYDDARSLVAPPDTALWG